MRRRAVLLLTLCLWGVAVAIARPVVMPSLAAPADTTRYGEDTEEDEDGTFEQRAKHEPRNYVVNGHNAINDVMEGRYVPTGETFLNKNKWLRNIFVQGGVGIEKIDAPTSDWRISPMSYAQLSVGKDFNKLNTARLTLHGAWGTERFKELRLSKYGVKLEHMYNLSSYFSGYNPSRLWGLSTILGVGLQSSKLENEGSGMSFEGHFGLQFRFFTGPKAYISLEPYVGIGGDKMDVSGTHNWRKADVFYGANLNFVYYLNNNLSPESHRRLTSEVSERNQLSKDSLMEKWQQPWMVQVSTGAAMMQDQPNMSMSKTMGSELALTVGKWLSPVMGLRLTGYSRTNVWNRQIILGNESGQPGYEVNLHNITVGGRLEAMLNPLGFLKNFYWDAPFGFYLVGGAEMGWLLKKQTDQLSCSMIGWGGGVNLWYQLTPGTKLFVEPRFMHNEYNIPYTNVDRVKRYSDNYLTLNVGVAVEVRDDARYYSHSYYQEYVEDRLRQIKVGLGGGLHLLQTENAMAEGGGLGLNATLFGEYHFDRLKSVRLGVDFINMKRTSMTDYTDYNMDNPDVDYSPVLRNGLWDHKYQFFLISASGQVDMNYLTMHYQAQPLRLYAFGGPTLVYVMKYTYTLSPKERLMQRHRAEPINAEKVGFGIGAHLGVKLEYRIKPRLSAFLISTLYTLGSTKMPGVEFANMKLMQTFNLGVQYGF